MVNLIEGQVEQKGFAVGTFMDLEGASNHTSGEVIRAAMITHSVPTAVVEWTCHMLGNRNLTANRGNATLCGTVDSGCPQEGVLSLLLWCLVVDELLHQLSGQVYHPIGYADDILVMVRGQHLDANFGGMQQTLGIVDTWCKKTGLSINPNKTEVVVFTRRYKWRITSTLKLGGQQLKINEQAKYL